jgi:hypothetical protein
MRYFILLSFLIGYFNSFSQTISTIPQDPFCVGMCNGSIIANVNGGSGTYTYLWDDPLTQTTAIATDLCPGTYQVIITDTSGWVDSASVSIFDPIPLFVNTSSTNDSCGACVGSVSVNVSGGMFPYTYDWRDSLNQTVSTSAMATNLCAGVYTYTVTDANGCVDGGFETVGSIVGTNCISSFVVTTDPWCFGFCDGDITVNASGGTPPYTYSWNTFPAQNTQTAVGLCAGTYEVTITDANGAIAMQSGSVFDPQELFSSAISTNDSCGLGVGTTTVFPAGGLPPYNYSWSPSGQATAMATGLTAGVYNCTITDINGCSYMDVATVGSNNGSCLIVTATTIMDVSCPWMCDGSATVNVTGGLAPFTYVWANGATTQTVNGLCAGTYSVIVTDDNGVTGSTSVTIVEPPYLTTFVTTTPDTCGLCVGTAESIVTGGIPPYTYSWSPGGETTPSVSGLCGGLYDVTITDMNGCSWLDTTSISTTNNLLCDYGTISGTVYNSLNSNCIQDSVEVGLANVMLVAMPGPYYATTDASGDYTFNIPYDSYTITQVGSSYYNEVCPIAGSHTVVLDSTNNTIVDIDFLNEIIPVQDVSVSLSGWNAVPGFIMDYWISYTSINPAPMSGTVSLVVDPTLIYIGANPTPDAISGDTLFWNYTNLQQFENRWISIDYQVPADVNLLGIIIPACSEITPLIGDLTPVNNTSCYDVVVVGSYDPNDKQVEPKGVGSTGDILLSENELKYTVRFQNTGTFMATNVVVEDMLSANLDVTTLRDVTASHPFTYNVSGQGLLTFTFNGINLPDSNANEPESHGLIEFTIEQNAANTIGTVIENTAEIYFDFNPAIITNTVVNTIVTVTSVNENEFSLNDVNVYPNPSNGKFAIAYRLENASDVRVRIVDVVGKVIKSIPVQNMTKGEYKTEINISNMNSGIYFMSIQIGEENHIKKIVVQ